MSRARMLQLIEENVRKHGFHIYLIESDAVPRYVYTIGLSQCAGVELVLAGAAMYSQRDIGRIINSMGRECIATRAIPLTHTVGQLGSFTFTAVERSWVSTLLLGAIDFYATKDVAALQVLPDAEHWTVDIPRLAKPRSAASEPVWQWLDTPWQYPVPEASRVVTNLPALRGARITEATRWEDNEWEMFAGDDTEIPKKDMRIVPLGTMLATDPTLDRVIRLGQGEGLWRDAEGGPWHRMGVDTPDDEGKPA